MNIDPTLVVAALPKELRWRAVDLVYGAEKYFVDLDGVITVPLERLRLSRARPDGIASAIARMAEAAAGTRTRRAPVNVQQRSDGLLDVLDGNSTVVAAAAAGWPDLPCVVNP